MEEEWRPEDQPCYDPELERARFSLQQLDILEREMEILKRRYGVDELETEDEISPEELAALYTEMFGAEAEPIESNPLNESENFNEAWHNDEPGPSRIVQVMIRSYFNNNVFQEPEQPVAKKQSLKTQRKKALILPPALERKRQRAKVPYNNNREEIPYPSSIEIPLPRKKLR